MEEEERKELERLLAAELAALTVDDEVDGEVPEDPERTPYVRLDLERVLRETESSALQVGGDDGTWKMLLDSVAVSDAHVFQVFADEMQQLRAEIMPAMTAMADSVLAERGSGAGGTETHLPVAHEHVAAVDGEIDVRVVETADRMRSWTVEGDAECRPADEGSIVVEVADNFTSELATQDNEGHDVHIVNETTTVTASKSLPSDALTQEQEHRMSTTTRVEEAVQETQRQVAEVASVLAQREALRVKAQEQAKAAKEEMEAWLREQQRRMEAELEEKQRRREEATRRREACEQMEREERRTKRVEELQRLMQERKRMQDEEESARRIECWRVKLADTEAKERAQMAQEETRVWRVIKAEQDRERKEKLVEEQSRLRRWHRRVMEEMAARAEAKRRAADAEKRRAMREAAEMRSEEHWMRRMLVQERAVREETQRQRNRRSMEYEDQLATAVREDETRVMRESQGREGMAREEERSRIWETLWRLRIKGLGQWINGEAKRATRSSWKRWQAVVSEDERRQVEAEQMQKLAEAGERIQQWMRRNAARRRRMRQDEHSEASAAAKVVQSAFRGFHVRRRFQNALDMARSMRGEGVDDDDFGEVNLEDLIQEPPELDEDWERPDMTMICVKPKPAASPVQPESEGEEDVEEDAEDDDIEGDQDERVEQEWRDAKIEDASSQRRQHPAANASKAPQEVEGGNLAVVLWNKMRKKTQKRQHALEERQRQKDPAYRVKKLLSKNANPQGHAIGSLPVGTSSSASTPATITWSTPSDKKKAPKVKLPSLVERLRKKTAAAR